MPEFHLSPSVLPAGIPTAVELVVSAGQTACRQVAFEVWLPRGLRATGLPPRHQLSEVAPGAPVRLPFRLTAATPGDWVLEIRNLCFRDAAWTALNRPQLAVAFRAGAPGPEAGAPPELMLESLPAEILPAAPTRWQVRLCNRGGGPARRISVTLADSWAAGSACSQAVVAELAPGATTLVSLVLTAPGNGPATVPVNLQWLDAAGALGERRVGVPAVFASVPPGRRPAAETGRRPCLLFVAAEPRSGPGEAPRNVVGFPPPPRPSASPRHRLRLDYEFRLVREAVWQLGDRLAVEHLPAAGLDQLATALLRLRPAFVHVSCHGSTAGELCLEDDDSGGQLLSAAQLAAVLQGTAADHRCLFLNGCFTDRLAPALRTAADWLVVSRVELDDDLAIRFARTFYEGLAGGLAVDVAFGRAEAMADARSVYRLLSGRPGAAGPGGD